MVALPPRAGGSGSLRPRLVIADRGASPVPAHAGVYNAQGTLVVEHALVGLAVSDMNGGGDVDGDGVPDVAISTNDEPWVISGVDGALSELPIPGPTVVVRSVGDVDGDGRDDLACRRTFLGSFLVIRSGLDLGVLASLDPEGYGLNATSVTPLGDVNRDGHDDFLVGSPGNTFSNGDVIKIYGAKGATVHSGIDIPFLRLDVGALPGTQGEPALRLAGEPAAGKRIDVTVIDARPGATVMLVLGTLFRPTPFLGGTFVPALGPRRVLGMTDAHGSLVTLGRWPPGIAAGDLLYAQAWVADPVAVEGWAATDTVEITAQ